MSETFQRQKNQSLIPTAYNTIYHRRVYTNFVLDLFKEIFVRISGKRHEKAFFCKCTVIATL